MGDATHPGKIAMEDLQHAHALHARHCGASSRPTEPRGQWVFAQLTRAATELSAMLLGASELASTP